MFNLNLLTRLTMLGALGLIAFSCHRDEQPSQAVRPTPDTIAPVTEATTTAALNANKPAPIEETATGSEGVAQAKALSDGQIAAITDGANSSEIDQATIAQTKAKNSDVKAFAAMMIKHHGEAKEKQAKLKLTPADSPLLKQNADEAAHTLAMLQSTRPADFDQAYMQAQVSGHQKVLDTVTGQLVPNAHSPELKAYLGEIKTTVESHLKRAGEIAKKLPTSPNTVSEAAATKP